MLFNELTGSGCKSSSSVHMGNFSGRRRCRKETGCTVSLPSHLEGRGGRERERERFRKRDARERGRVNETRKKEKEGKDEREGYRKCRKIETEIERGGEEGEKAAGRKERHTEKRGDRKESKKEEREIQGSERAYRLDCHDRPRRLAVLHGTVGKKTHT